MALHLDRMHDGRPSHRLTLTIDYGQVLRFVAAELLSSGRVLRIRGRLNSLRLIGLPRAQSRRVGSERLRAARLPYHTALSHIGVFFFSVRMQIDQWHITPPETCLMQRLFFIETCRKS